MKKSKFYKTLIVYLSLVLIPLVALPQYAESMPASGNNDKGSYSLSLREILKDMEERYGVYFTYRNSTIANKPGHLYDRTNGVEKALEEVLSPEGLKFKKIDNIYIIYAEEEKPTVRQLKKVIKSTEQVRVWASNELETQPVSQLQALKSFMNPVEINVKGRVVNEDNEGMPGVNVLIKGTAIGTSTDSDGNYSIMAPENGTLVFSFIGYATQEVEIGNRTVVDISLVPDLEMLNEIVVVGYGTVEKKDLIGSVGVATNEDFGQVAVSNAQQLIQGKIAGVQVINSSGLPGANVKIAVRGTGTFTNADPLYVIDGIQGGVNTFNALSPYDIESVTVLKDASAAAIYGASAANGVVIVTTKKAKSGAPRVSYNGYVGVAQAWKQLDVMNAEQYIDLVREMTNNNVPPKLETDYVLQDRTDWQDEIFRTAKLMEHNLSISGGTEKVTYSISTTYTDQDAIMENYNFKRINQRFAFEENLGKRFKLGQAINLRYTKTTGSTASFTDALRMPTYAPIYDPTNLGGYSKVTTADDLNDAYNPLTTIYLTDYKNKDFLAYGQFFGEVTLLEGLKFRTQASVDLGSSLSRKYKLPNQNGNTTNARSLEEIYKWSVSPLIENLLTYNRTFGIHGIDVLVGNTYRNGGENNELTLNGSDFPNDEIKNIVVSPNTSVGSARVDLYASISYFARVNYSLLDKYLFTASFRRDGSQNFLPANRFANFPSAGVAWKISEEQFLQPITAISMLKLRASYGILGNDRIPSQQAVVWKGSSNNIVYTLGTNEEYIQGATINSAIDPNIKWETTKQFDVGLDVGLFEDQLTFSLDYYERKNEDLLIGVPVPLTTGIGGPYDLPGKIILNAASAFNKGFEATVGYQGLMGDFKYGINANLAYNVNEVTSLGNGLPFQNGNVNGGNLATRTDIGQPIGSFYGYKVDHVAVDQAEVNNLNQRAREITGDASAIYQAELRPGDIIFKDVDNDGRVTDKDRTFLGSAIPKWNYGANLNLGYKNFDFMLSLYGIGGVKIWNDLKYWTEGTARPFNSSADLVNRWRTEGDVSEYPKAGQNANSSLNLRPSDRFVENGSYMRIRNITLGYNLPVTTMGSVAKTFSSVRVYVTAQNPITITKYKGYDPEIGAQDANSAESFIFARGIDAAQYPQPRSFMLGVQLGF